MKALFKRIFIGHSYGHIKVLDRGPGGWSCSCSCGWDGCPKTVIIPNKDLRRGKKSCGACRIKTKEIETSPEQRFYKSYLDNALKRGYVFNLSFEEFMKLAKSPCFYCGVHPRKRNEGKRAIVVNGVDRCDNKLGYVENNCVTACGTCNLAKRTMSVEKFLKWAKRLAEYQGWAQQELPKEHIELPFTPTHRYKDREFIPI